VNVVVVYELAVVEVGNVHIDVTVVVVISSCDVFGEGDFVDAGSRGNLLKGPVPLIEEELARPVLVADKKIEETVVVDVRPNSCLCASGGRGQARFARDVRKGSVAIVPQKRFAHGEFPGAAQDEDVHTAVVLVIGLDHVQSPQLSGGTGLRRSLGTPPVPSI